MPEPRYKFRDLSRDLYLNHDWSIAEIENKYQRKVTAYDIPQWMRDKKNEVELLRSKREEKNKRLSEAYYRRYNADKSLRERERARKLSKAEARKVRSIAHKIQMDNVKQKVEVIKQCPANSWLMGE